MRLLSLSNEEIMKYVDALEKEAEAIKADAMRIMWYMRGSITFDQAMMMSHKDKTIASSIIKENLEIAKKTGMPFF